LLRKKFSLPLEIGTIFRESYPEFLNSPLYFDGVELELEQQDNAILAIVPQEG
jgi:hypothetical protein